MVLGCCVFVPVGFGLVRCKMLVASGGCFWWLLSVCLKWFCVLIMKCMFGSFLCSFFGLIKCMLCT